MQDDWLALRLLPTGIRLEIASLGLSARFQHDGVWCTARLDGNFYRRCVDGRVNINNRLQPHVGADTVQTQLVAMLTSRSVHDALVNKTDGLLWLEKITTISASHFDDLEHRFKQRFAEGVPVLPPDRYRDYVVPITTGCPNRRCTFCGFYRGRPFRRLIKDDTEWPSVVNQILPEITRLQGAGRTGLFLGSANALALPGDSLLSWLKTLTDYFGVLPDGIACFADADYISAQNRQLLGDFSRQGLAFVVLGLETGSPTLRGSLNKKADVGATIDMVRALHREGIHVGLTILTGGFAEYDFAEHLLKTVAVIQSMSLTPNDRVYVSPWFADNARVPSAQAMEEMTLMSRALKQVTAARVTGYSAHNFFYFA